jgi:hypothetical protein
LFHAKAQRREGAKKIPLADRLSSAVKVGWSVKRFAPFHLRAFA